MIGALIAASEWPLKWIAEGCPATREYLSDEIDGNPQLVDARVWPDRPLSPGNHTIPLTYAAPTGKIDSTIGGAAPSR